MDCRELRREIADVERAIERAKKNKNADEEEYLRRVLSDLNKQYEEECIPNIYRM